MSEDSPNLLPTRLNDRNNPRQGRVSRFGEKPLNILRSASPHGRQIRLSIHPDIVKAVGFRDRQRMMITADGSRVAHVGLSHASDGYFPRFRGSATSRGLYVATFPTRVAAEVFLPRSYPSTSRMWKPNRRPARSGSPCLTAGRSTPSWRTSATLGRTSRGSSPSGVPSVSAGSRVIEFDF